MKTRFGGRWPAALALVLSGCCMCGGSGADGNSPTGKFNLVDGVVGQEPTFKRFRSLAVGGAVDLQVFQPRALRGAGQPVEGVEAVADGDGLEVLAEGTVVSVRAKGPGTGVVRIGADLGAGPVTEDVPFEAHAAGEVSLQHGCKGSEAYWVGMPAHVRYRLDSASGERLYGTGVFPVKSSDPGITVIPERSGLYEWAFQAPDAPARVTLSSTVGKVRPLELAFENPPKIDKLAILDVPTGKYIETVKLPRKGETSIRVFPVAEGGELMCNTSVPAEVTASEGCMARALDTAAASGGPGSAVGMFAVAAIGAAVCKLSVRSRLLPDYELPVEARPVLVDSDVRGAEPPKKGLGGLD